MTKNGAPASLPVSLSDVEAAAATLAGFVKRTSFDHSRTLSDITGSQIWLKFENLQFTATFKERGALNRLAALSPDQRKQGVIAASAGNHAQGVAYHAARLSIPATIFVPVGAPTWRNRDRRRRDPRGSSVAGAKLRQDARPDLHPSLRRSADHCRPGNDRAGDAGRAGGSRRLDRADRRRRAHLRHGGGGEG